MPAGVFGPAVRVHGLVASAASRSRCHPAALFVADGRANQVLELNESGSVVRRFGQKGGAAGQFDLPHMLTFDADANLLVTEINGRRLQKFAKR